MKVGRFKICSPVEKTLKQRIKSLAIRFSVRSYLALWLAPQIDKARRRHLRGQVIELHQSAGPHEVNLEQKISAAVYIVAHGVNGAGVSTWATLMHPMRTFNLDDVAIEASRLLADAVRLSVGHAPQSQIDQILKDQDERMMTNYVC